MNKEYKITTLADIRDKVPVESREDFLKDLACWLNMPKVNEAYIKVVEELGKAIGIEATVEHLDPDTMLWVDDGEAGHVTFQIQEPQLKDKK